MRPISHAIPGALVELLREAPASAGKIELAWNAAVGSAIQRATAVRLEGTVLFVDIANESWAREVRRSLPTILPRLQMLLGKDTVTALEIRHHERRATDAERRTSSAERRAAKADHHESNDERRTTERRTKIAERRTT